VSRWLDITAYNICRDGGGLGLGVRMHFPVAVLYDDNDRRSVWTVDFTLGCFIVVIDLKLRYE
jgi:hypothetical protein